ncbi:O-antigen ligase family protein [Opitutus sp. ER46]|uniref:O-antigen ligase family protein n=1 Tax=Opitutus sp. ER46 TaxID=2161864 RepID=UPI001304C4A3|nr:O-antigen ligase family protein [Opitutus sp. ER46]
MNPRTRDRLGLAAGGVLAVAVGWWVASGDFLLPTLLAVAGVAGACTLALGLSFDVLVLGGLLVGYIVGNRGFAQLSLVPGFPLLPAEAGLALGLGWLGVRAAVARRWPWRRDALNVAVLAWMIIASGRIVTDVRVHGFLALRDFAMVYYALFFFVAQDQAARTGLARRFLGGALLLATVAAIPLFEFFRRYPEFFLQQLTFRGTPLIFVKGDLVATFLAAGVILTFARFERTRRWPWLLLALAGTVTVLSSDNRASLVGLLAATGWFVLARRWLWLKVQALALGCAALLLLGAAVFGWVSPGARPLTPVYQRVASIVGVGSGASADADAGYKIDNNRFRLVWWQMVARETLTQAPWFGLGFGYDLAEPFTRVYFPDAEEDFTARSPHSIVVTALGRTGVIGLTAFLVVIGAIAARTWRELRLPASTGGNSEYWLVAWVILTSACFGVVLEGPMGAVVFWTVLGLANAPREGVTASADALGEQNSDF